MATRTRSRSSGDERLSVTMDGTTRNADYSAEWSDTSFVSYYQTPAERSTMIDVVTPDFRKRQSAGEIINNPVDIFTERWSDPQPEEFVTIKTQFDGQDPPVLFGSTWNGLRALTPEQMGDFLTLSTSEEDTIQSRIDLAVTTAHSNASSCELIVPMVLAEGKKSLYSITKLLFEGTQMLRAVRRKDFAYLKGKLTKRELIEKYMEMRYAIRPLMIDIVNLCKALEARESINKSMRQTSRGYATYISADNDTIPFTAFSSDTIATIKRSVRKNVIIRAGVLSDVTLSDLSIFGVDQLLETALEVTPYSFIANWFFNIADTLSAWTPNVGMSELASWVTVITEVTQTNTLEGIDSYEPTGSWTTKYRSYNSEKSYTSRHVVRTPNPNLRFWPRMSVNLDDLKLLDLAIILKGMADSPTLRI